MELGELSEPRALKATGSFVPRLRRIRILERGQEKWLPRFGCVRPRRHPAGDSQGLSPW